MTQHQHPTYRSTTTPDTDAVTYRAPEGEEGVFEVRMPIATTGTVRNEGDEPLTRDALDGMARQIEERSVSVFLDHGDSMLGGRSRYSAVEKLGEWTDPDVRTRDSDDESELVATARLMDPETLPNGVSSIREAVGAIKEQVKRGFSVSASIGWREDESYPGGNDLMEASIVGIGADPRTTSQASTAVVARAAVDAGADPEELVAAVREAVTGMERDSDDMTTQDTPPDDGGTTDEAQNTEPDEAQAPDDDGEVLSAEEFRSEMLAMQEQQLELLEALASDDDGDMDDDDEEEDEQQAEEDEDEEDDEEGEQAADHDDVEERLAAMEEELAAFRNGDLAPDTPDTDGERDSEQVDEQLDTVTKYGLHNA